MEDGIAAQFTNTIGGCFAEVGNDYMASLMISWVMEMTPDTDSEIPSVIQVSHTRLTVFSTHLDDVASDLRSLGPVVGGPWIFVG